MSENTRLWDALSKTDPKHTKPFKRAGGFQGTAIKPIWLTKRMTEQFGAAGTGWGMTEPKFETVATGDEILVFCTVALWYGSQDCRVYGVGGDKVMGKNKYGPFTNDEAFKASYTDALSNAMKQIGLGADIHMGMFDDEKYVRETAREFNDPPPVPPEDRALLKNGETRSQYEVDKRAAAEKFVRDTLAAWESLQTGSDLSDWFSLSTSPKGRSTNRDAVNRLSDAFPDLHQRLMTAAEEIRLRGGTLLQ